MYNIPAFVTSSLRDAIVWTKILNLLKVDNLGLLFENSFEWKIFVSIVISSINPYNLVNLPFGSVTEGVS